MQLGSLVGNSLVGICLTLPNLGFLWVFFKYPKISKNGNKLFFPVSKSFMKFIAPTLTTFNYNNLSSLSFENMYNYKRDQSCLHSKQYFLTKSSQSFHRFHRLATDNRLKR